MIFRKATKEDIDAVSEIFNDIHVEIEKGIIWIGWIKDVYPTRATVVAAVERQDLFVLEADGTIAGTGIINHQQADVYKDVDWHFPAPDEKVMVLHTLAISPKFGRRGYGSAFIAFYEQYALEHGCPFLRLDTNEKNANARMLYKKLGYEERGTIPCMFNGINDFRLVMLEKYLG